MVQKNISLLNPLKIGLLAAAFAMFTGQAAEAKTLKGMIEALPSSYVGSKLTTSLKTASGNMRVAGFQVAKGAQYQTKQAGKAGYAATSRAVNAVYVTGAGAANLLANILDNTLLTELRSEKTGLWINVDQGSSLFKGLAYGTAHAGVAVWNSAEFATRTASALAQAAAAGSLYLISTAVEAGRTAILVADKLIVRPTLEAVNCIYTHTVELVKNIGQFVGNTAAGVAKGAAGVATYGASTVPGVLGGVAAGLGLTKPTGNQATRAASQMRQESGKIFKSSGKSFKAAVK